MSIPQRDTESPWRDWVYQRQSLSVFCHWNLPALSRAEVTVSVLGDKGATHVLYSCQDFSGKLFSSQVVHFFLSGELSNNQRGLWPLTWTLLLSFTLFLWRFHCRVFERFHKIMYIDCPAQYRCWTYARTFYLPCISQICKMSLHFSTIQVNTKQYFWRSLLSPRNWFDVF